MATLLTDLSQIQHQHQKNLQVKQQKQEQVNNTLSPASPASSSSSPSHEFSFTISLHSSSSSSTQQISNDRTKTHHLPNNPFAVDLSPADEIFFHGHLLPLHLLTNLPVSQTRDPSPVKVDDHHSCSSISSSKNNIGGSESFSSSRGNKPKSFSSIFGWRKGFEVKEKDDHEKKKKKNKRKSSFDLSHVLKKYARMVRPLLFFKGRKEEEDVRCQRQAHSFSDSSSWTRNKKDPRGELFSAPASMRTSPSNSGLLLPLPPRSTRDSTMEELQAAIQAAIAHCKNSIATEEKVKFQS